MDRFHKRHQMICQVHRFILSQGPFVCMFQVVSTHAWNMASAWRRHPHRHDAVRGALDDEHPLAAGAGWGVDSGHELVLRLKGDGRDP